MADQISTSSSAVARQDQDQFLTLTNPTTLPPIILSYNNRIRPLLNAIDKLRHLNITKEGIQLPTIVVVGDQSSGKSSVLESLAGINLPRGQGICTRVPLIMRLQNLPAHSEHELYLEYNNKTIHIEEALISQYISTATDEMAGASKGISNTPLTLVVKKNGVPDLTMIDLPGITRVPVKGQPEDIYEQVRDMIMEYIKPEESIILNVLSATVDFSTCESIRMSQSVDRSGKRTLAVVTKADESPEGLLEKVTSDDVNIGLGYVCVRNRIGEETFEEARMEEATLFQNHPLLSKMARSIVGVPVLAQKLVEIQASIIARCLPEIVKQINEKLTANVTELNKMPKKLSSVAEAMTTFMQIVGQAKDSLRKIVLRGEYDEYPENEKMHCTARLVEMIDQYSIKLNNNVDQGDDQVRNFLKEEISVLEEARGIGLPNFLPHNAFLSILQRKVKGISYVPIEFVEKVWDYLQGVVLLVLMHHFENYIQLQLPIRRAGQNVVEKMKERSVNWITEIVKMEKAVDYTCDQEYLADWNELMALQDEFIKGVLRKDYRPTWVTLEGFGQIEVGNLWEYPDALPQAFDLKMRMVAYWKIVLRRLVDCTVLYLQFGIQNLVNKEMESEIVGELMNPTCGGLERMLEESPSHALKREKLKNSIKLLKESKVTLLAWEEVWFASMDGVSLKFGDCGALLRSVEEAQEQDELTSHSNFSESTQEVLNLVCTKYGKPCRSKTESDLHTKRTGLTEFTNKTSEAAKPISLEVPKAAVDSEDPADVGPSQPEEMVVLEVDKKLLEELEALGFSTARATRALHYSGNASLEAAVYWVVEHESDPDIDQMPMVSPSAKVEASIRSATKVEQMRECLRSLKKTHKDDDAKVKRAFQTLLTYIGNVVKNPEEEKFRKIRLTNQSFQDRVGLRKGGIEFLVLCGFEKVEGCEFLFLQRDKVDKAILNSAGAELDAAIKNPFFGVL